MGPHCSRLHCGYLHVVVRAPRRNLLRTVQLLSNDQPHELVRKHELREAPHKIRAQPQPIIDTVRTPDHHHDALTSIERTAKRLREFGGVHVLAALIEQHDELV